MPLAVSALPAKSSMPFNTFIPQRASLFKATPSGVATSAFTSFLSHLRSVAWHQAWHQAPRMAPGATSGLGATPGATHPVWRHTWRHAPDLAPHRKACVSLIKWLAPHLWFWRHAGATVALAPRWRHIWVLLAPRWRHGAHQGKPYNSL